MPLQKAMIIVDRGKNSNDSNDSIEVLFNPSEYTLDSGNTYNWMKIQSLSMPIGQYAYGNGTTLSVELFFDTYEEQSDVRDYTNQIVALMDKDSTLRRPPVCRFVWGSLDFQGVIEKVTQNFIMFLDSGIPVRAKLKVSFRSWKDPEELMKELPPARMAQVKQRIRKQQEELWMIADQEYGDPGRWREIADANNINNPRRMETGRKITVPGAD
ncbi:CIS tube protein [Paenibacillus turpanensis]|uniref:CIS tube protein n=1 Tax=Paenibacillus turpanensis TaxID=2689078 RepID=UPI00140D53F7|nr:peptidoglycan-binding protein [Paenibacillus turpanensis]